MGSLTQSELSVWIICFLLGSLLRAYVSALLSQLPITIPFLSFVFNICLLSSFLPFPSSCVFVPFSVPCLFFFLNWDDIHITTTTTKNNHPKVNNPVAFRAFLSPNQVTFWDTGYQDSNYLFLGDTIQPIKGAWMLGGNQHCLPHLLRERIIGLVIYNWVRSLSRQRQPGNWSQSPWSRRASRPWGDLLRDVGAWVGSGVCSQVGVGSSSLAQRVRVQEEWEEYLHRGRGVMVAMGYWLHTGRLIDKVH